MQRSHHPTISHPEAHRSTHILDGQLLGVDSVVVGCDVALVVHVIEAIARLALVEMVVFTVQRFLGSTKGTCGYWLGRILDCSALDGFPLMGAKDTYGAPSLVR